jgi:very-short-patch-repair endonuclease
MVTEPHEFARRLHKVATRAEDRLRERLRGSRLKAAKFKRQGSNRPLCRRLLLSRRKAGGRDRRKAAWLEDAYDEARTKTLEAAGVHVMRFDNREVLDDLDDVLRRIGEELRLPFD